MREKAIKPQEDKVHKLEEFINKGVEDARKKHEEENYRRMKQRQDVSFLLLYN